MAQAAGLSREAHGFGLALSCAALVLLCHDGKSGAMAEAPHSVAINILPKIFVGRREFSEVIFFAWTTDRCDFWLLLRRSALSSTHRSETLDQIRDLPGSSAKLT